MAKEDDQKLQDMLRAIEAGELPEDLNDPEDYDDMGGIKSLDRGAPSIKMASEPEDEFELELQSVINEYNDLKGKGDPAVRGLSIEEYINMYLSKKKMMEENRAMAMGGGMMRMGYAGGTPKQEEIVKPPKSMMMDTTTYPLGQDPQFDDKLINRPDPKDSKELKRLKELMERRKKEKTKISYGRYRRSPVVPDKAPPKKPKKFMPMLDMLNTEEAVNSMSPKTHADYVAIFSRKAFENGEIDVDEYLGIVKPLFGETGEKVTNKIKEYEDELEKYATGGRVNFLDGGDTAYNKMVTEAYIKAGGLEATGMDIDKFAEMYFKKFADGGRAQENLVTGLPIKQKTKTQLEVVRLHSQKNYLKNIKNIKKTYYQTHDDTI